MKTKDFDKAFDEGSDLIDQVIQWDKKYRPELEAKSLHLDFPTWMINEIDKEAAKLEVPRSLIIKMWMKEKIESLGRTQANAKSTSSLPRFSSLD